MDDNSGARFPPTALPTPRWVWGLLGLAMAACVLAALLAGPDSNCDLRNYHIYNGYYFLHDGGDRNLFPSQLQAWNNPVFNVLTVLLIYHLPPMAVAATLALIQSLNIPLIYMVSRQILGEWLADLTARARAVTLLAVVAVGATGAMTLSEIGTTFSDNVTSLLLLLGMLACGRVFEAGREDGKRAGRYAFLAGAAFGLSCGIKMTNVVFLPGVALMLLCLKGSCVRRAQLLAWGALGTFLGWAVLDGWWAWAMWRETGNPIFPQMNNLFRSPWFDPVDVADLRFRPASFGAALLFPFRTALGDHPGAEVFFCDSRFAVALLLTPALLLRRPRGWPAAALIFFGVGYALWLALFGIERYAIPLEMLSGAMIAVLLFQLAAPPALKPALAVGMSVLLASTTIVAEWGHVESWGAVGRNGNWFHVEVPEELTQPHQMFLLLDGDRASAYIVPQFRADSQFVRMQGSIAPSPGTGLYRQRMRAIAAHDGPLYAVSILAPNAAQAQLLAPYGVRFGAGGCATLRANIETLLICPLVHLPVETRAP